MTDEEFNRVVSKIIFGQQPSVSGYRINHDQFNTISYHILNNIKKAHGYSTVDSWMRYRSCWRAKTVGPVGSLEMDKDSFKRVVE